MVDGYFVFVSDRYFLQTYIAFLPTNSGISFKISPGTRAFLNEDPCLNILIYARFNGFSLRQTRWNIPFFFYFYVSFVQSSYSL